MNKILSKHEQNFQYFIVWLLPVSSGSMHPLPFPSEVTAHRSEQPPPRKIIFYRAGGCLAAAGRAGIRLPKCTIFSVNMYNIFSEHDQYFQTNFSKHEQ